MIGSDLQCGYHKFLPKNPATLWIVIKMTKLPFLILLHITQTHDCPISETQYTTGLITDKECLTHIESSSIWNKIMGLPKMPHSY